MSTILPALLCALHAAAEPAGHTANARLEHRWFFSFGYERNAADIEKIKSLVGTAAAHGFNGMVLSSWDLDAIDRWPREDIARLRDLAAYCASKGIEIIPTGLSVGYGGGALAVDRSFAAALPVTLALKAAGNRIVPVAGRNLMANGGLEKHNGDHFADFAFADAPGRISFADAHAASGSTAIRFEGFGTDENGHGRIMQKVSVEPGHAYRFTFKLKTESLEPVSGFKAMVLADGRDLASSQVRVNPTQDWTGVTLDYIDHDQTSVAVYAGIWGGKSGRFWLDDFTFNEPNDLSDIVRREGTPIDLRSRDREQAFVEGKDFEPIRCLTHLDGIKILPGSAISDGENLTLSCYKIPSVQQPWGKQISLCMSNPALYTYWADQLRKLHDVLPFKRFLLSMDEIRNGGGCLSCRNRHISMAEILGDCITRERAMLKQIDPAIEVLIWSDMLDPVHNAHDKYYGVVGDFTGSWKSVPKDLTMMCWSAAIMDRSLGFFSAHGFPVMGAAYYDSSDLAGSGKWLEVLNRTPNARGIMYTTWEKKYALMSAFGDLVSRPPDGPAR